MVSDVLSNSLDNEVEEDALIEVVAAPFYDEDYQVPQVKDL